MYRPPSPRYKSEKGPLLRSLLKGGGSVRTQAKMWANQLFVHCHWRRGWGGGTRLCACVRHCLIVHASYMLQSNAGWYVLRLKLRQHQNHFEYIYRAVFTWLSKGIGFGFGFGFTTPFGWLLYLLWFWFYDSQVKTALGHLFTHENGDFDAVSVMVRSCAAPHRSGKRIFSYRMILSL